jgi:hypothetical protein
MSSGPVIVALPSAKTLTERCACLAVVAVAAETGGPASAAGRPIAAMAPAMLKRRCNFFVMVVPSSLHVIRQRHDSDQ